MGGWGHNVSALAANVNDFFLNTEANVTELGDFSKDFSGNNLI